MAKSLAELRNSPHVGLPEWTYPLCVAGKLSAEFDKIDAEIEEALAEDFQKPRRNAEKPRTHKLNQRREELRKQMAEHEVELRFRARPNDKWREWVNDHPPREDNRVDERAGLDVDALTARLRDYAVSINGEDITDDDWSFCISNAAPGDMWRMTALVLKYHQQGVDIPKSLTGWLETRRRSKTSD